MPRAGVARRRPGFRACRRSRRRLRGPVSCRGAQMTAVTDHNDILREVLRTTNQSKRAIDQRLRAFDQIPFLCDELRESHIQLLPEDPVPEKIDPIMIRKATQENCLLSPPLRVGEVLYFNILKETDEINID